MAAAAGADDVDHFRSKFAIEAKVREAGPPFTFIGTVWFMDNVNDPEMGGAMTFPALSESLGRDTPFHMLRVDDLGAAVAEVLLAPDRHVGQRLDLAVDVLTVLTMKKAYRKATGRHPKPWALPNLAMRWFAADFAAQLRWHEKVGWRFTPAALHGLVPDASTFAEYLRDKPGTRL